MNERIRQLALQAGVQDNPDREGLVLFAELIIRECMACSTWVGKMNTNSVEPVHTAHAINQRIKELLELTNDRE